MLAFGASIMVHTAWNATTTPLINRVLGAFGGRDAADTPWNAMVAGSLVALPYLAVPAVVLVVAWRRAGRADEEPASPAESAAAPTLAGDAG